MQTRLAYVAYVLIKFYVTIKVQGVAHRYNACTYFNKIELIEERIKNAKYSTDLEDDGLILKVIYYSTVSMNILYIKSHLITSQKLLNYYLTADFIVY